MALPSIFFAVCSLAATPPANIFPVNTAEAVIEPFWSPELSGFSQWSVQAGPSYGLQIKQNWSAVDFEWAAKPDTGPALHMERDWNADCSRYDRLLVRLAAPAKSTVRIAADTDKGERVSTSPSANGKESEYTLNLDGAQRITHIILELTPTESGGACGWLRWIGLQHSERLKDYAAQWDFSTTRWEAYLKPVDYAPAFKPVYGIFLNEVELKALRDQHAQALAQTGHSVHASRAEAARTMEFEKGIHEFAKTGGDVDIHGRDRDAQAFPLPGNPDLAETALVLQDAALLRAAARFALCLALSEHWEQGFLSCMPGNPWEDRAFRRSYCAEDIARVLDLAGEILSDTGRAYLLRRLAEEGVGPINFVLWRHEYVFHCNQLAFFNQGRMCAYLVMEREWPRVKPYTDLAREDSIDALQQSILPDGGYDEGPSYFAATAGRNCTILELYARARGLDAAALVPEILRKTGNFAALIASTTNNDVIPICDSGPDFSGSHLDKLIKLLPESPWITMANKQRLSNGETLLPGAPALPSFISLPEMGPMASVRMMGELPVKLFIMGNHANATHTHEDKGSFVLEFAGQTFAMDLGICEYDDPIHNQYKQCQRHNMLVPVGMPERAHPLNPIPVDVKPSGQGDVQTFHAQIDATPGWDAYYKKWIRTWDAPAPDTLLLRDEYELAQGSSVECYWQTELPCLVEGSTVRISGKRGDVLLTAPQDCVIRLDSLPMYGGGAHNRIAIQKCAPSGTLELSVRLTPKG